MDAFFPLCKCKSSCMWRSLWRRLLLFVFKVSEGSSSKRKSLHGFGKLIQMPHSVHFAMAQFIIGWRWQCVSVATCIDFCRGPHKLLIIVFNEYKLSLELTLWQISFFYETVLWTNKNDYENKTKTLLSVSEKTWYLIRVPAPVHLSLFLTENQREFAVF